MNNSLEYLIQQREEVEIKLAQAKGFLEISKAKTEYIHLHMLINIIQGNTEIALMDASMLFSKFKSIVDFLENEGN